MFCIKELNKFENFRYLIDFCNELDLMLFNKQENKIEAKIVLDLKNNYVLLDKNDKEIARFANLREALKNLWEVRNV